MVNMSTDTLPVTWHIAASHVNFELSTSNFNLGESTDS